MLFLGAFTAKAQAPEWIWAKSAGGTGSDGAKNISLDGSGNVYMAGSFQSTTITFGTTTLYNYGGAGGDIFLTKYDANGNVLWAKSPYQPGGYFDIINSIAADNAGNVYVTGYFQSSTITFGSITLTSVGGGDIFLAKYDPSGNVLWAKSAGGTGSDMANSVALDNAGGVYIAGNFQSPTIVFGSTTLTNAGGGDLFYAKYDTGGTAIWAKSAGGPNYDEATSITISPTGILYIAGDFNSDTLIIGTDTLLNAGSGSSDILLMKCNGGGSPIWAKSAGGPNYDAATSVVTDAAGNPYMSGYFKSFKIRFGSDTLTNAGTDYDDIFIVKFNSSGAPQWAQRAGGINNDDPYSLLVAPSGSVYVSGDFSSPSIIFGPDTLTLTGLFLAKYDATGNALWAKDGDGGTGNSIALNSEGYLYMGGGYGVPSIAFDTITLTNNGIINIYLAKLDTAALRLIVNSERNTLSIELFPNPSTGILTLVEDQPAKLEILNMQGQVVRTIEAGSNITHIDVSDLNTGIYFLRIITTSGIAVKEFIKE